MKHRAFLFPPEGNLGKDPNRTGAVWPDIVRMMFFLHATHMKLNRILILIAPLAFAGCVQSHQAPVEDRVQVDLH